MTEENGINLKVITPSGVIYDDGVDMVIMRSQEGDLGVLPRHEPLAAALGYGITRAIKNGEEIQFSVLGGFAEITGDSVTILSDAAERPDQIDAERALKAKERAENMLKSPSDEVDIQKASLALRRSLVRIEASSYPLIGGRTGSQK
jgi:F-type H+-transporting ATPase subunit epsilon